MTAPLICAQQKVRPIRDVVHVPHALTHASCEINVTCVKVSAEQTATTREGRCHPVADG